MRLLGILLLLGGLYFAIAKPWFSTQFTGEKIATSTLFQKGDGWRAGTVELDDDDGPFRTRINVYRLQGKIRSRERLHLIFRVQDANSGSVVVEKRLALNLDEASNNTRSDVEQLHSVAVEAFDVPDESTYKVGVVPVSANNPDRVDLNIHPNILRVEAVTSQKVEAGGADNLFNGALMIGAGILLISLAGRRRRRARAPEKRPAEPIAHSKEHDAKRSEFDEPDRTKSDLPPDVPEPPIAPPKRESDVGKTIKWGRDAGKER